MEQNIKTEVQGSQNAVQPIDRSNEVLSDPETSYNDLLCILKSRPETEEADKLEHEERERKAEEARLRAALGEDYEAVVESDRKKSLEKAKRRPGAIQLRNEVPRLAMKQIGDDGLCEVFVNGYAIYDNGDRKTVLWIPDCGSATYNFTKLRDNEKQYQAEKDTVGLDVLGPAPWYIAVMVAGENNIERNLEHPKSVGTMSDTGVKEDYEVKAAFRWVGGTHFDNPEEAYIQKEEAEERKMTIREEIRKLKDRQREVAEMYYLDGMDQYEIADRVGITQASVNSRLKRARKKLEKPLKNLL